MGDWKDTKCGTCKIQRKDKICNSCKGFNKFVAMTNADRIRLMSDEDLAINMMCPNENGLAEIECNKIDQCNCYECILQWLKKDAEVENERFNQQKQIN